MLSGCLVEDPPDYTPPTRTPPRLNLTQTKPIINEVYVTTLGETIDFEIGVTSEDAGVEVHGYLMVDYPGGVRWSTWDGARVAPSTLEDVSRRLTFRVTVEQGELRGDTYGCHRVTLRVAHADNFDQVKLPLTFDKEDVAEAYWWLNVIDPESGQDGSVLEGCFNSTMDNR
jgi:hypothetical protein